MSRRILYLQYTNPAAYPPLQHGSRILANRGWEVLFLGREMDDTGDLRFPSHERITVKRLPSVSSGTWQKLHYLTFVLWAMRWTLRWRPDWVYVSDPLACPAAFLLSFLPGVSALYHEHDSPAPAAHAKEESAWMRVVRHGRRQLVQRAEVCVLPNEQRAQHFAEETEVPTSNVQCVWNCPARGEAKPRLTPGTVEDELRVLYHGSLNTARLPFSILKALSDLPERVRLEVVGYETIGSKGYLKNLEEYASRYDVLHRINIRGAIPQRAKLLGHARTCHVGLSFMPMHTDGLNMQYMAGASNKPFDYMASGLPLIVSDLPDWREMYVEPGYGLACDPRDPASIAEVLRFYVENPERRRQMGKEGHQRILGGWNYENQFRPVRERLTG